MDSTETCLLVSKYFYTSKERPDAALKRQIVEAKEVISALVDRPLLDFQYTALVCLVADILGGFAHAPGVLFPDSPLLKAINRGHFQIATAEFTKFCFVDGRITSRSWRKRMTESHLFATGKLVLDKSMLV